MTFELHHGDCIDVMRTLQSESVDAIVTSPPYAEQRRATYGGVREAQYPEWTVAWMTEAWRILKPDGSALINIRPHIKDGQISDYVLRTRIALRESGWSECEELIWHKGGGPLGHTKRPRRAYESILWFAKHGKPFSDPKAAGSPSRRIGGLEYGQRGPHIHAGQSKALREGVARVSDLIRVDVVRNDPGAKGHPATFPWELAAWCGKLICPPGGTILDPFSGSASTGVAAIRNGWRYVGIDAVQSYIEMSRARLERESRESAIGYSVG